MIIMKDLNKGCSPFLILMTFVLMSLIASQAEGSHAYYGYPAGLAHAYNTPHASYYEAPHAYHVS